MLPDPVAQVGWPEGQTTVLPLFCVQDFLTITKSPIAIWSFPAFVTIIFVVPELQVAIAETNAVLEVADEKNPRMKV